MLSNKTALITDASRGIEAEIAKELAKNGASVIINYNNSNRAAEEVVESITQNGGEAIAIQTDVSNEEEVVELFNKGIQKLGQIDIFVNNAGIMLTKKIEEVSLDEFQNIFNINVTGGFNTLKQAASKLNEGGSIINISSTVTRTMFPGYGPYCATKGAVEQLTRAFSKEIGHRAITVNSVSPGPVGTAFFLEGKTEEQVEQIASQSAFNRLGQPADIAQAITLLVSGKAHWISGQNVGVNGAMA